MECCSWESECQPSVDDMNSVPIQSINNAMMLKLLYLLLISDTLLLASEGGSISVTSSGGESLEKWSVGRCILVSMQAKIFIRTKVKQSQKKVEN